MRLQKKERGEEWFSVKDEENLLCEDGERQKRKVMEEGERGKKLSDELTKKN